MEPAAMTNVAIIGLGAMGSGMAANLVKGGLDVWAYDLNDAAIQQAIRAGASGRRIRRWVLSTPLPVFT